MSRSIIDSSREDMANASSAMQVAMIGDEIRALEREREEEKKLEAQRKATMVAGAEASIEQKKILEKELELLKEQNKSLQQQLELAMKNEGHAKAEANHNRLWVYITAGIAFASLIATILIAVLK